MAGGVSQPLLNPLTYDPADFRHIAMLMPYGKSTITVRTDSPFHTIEELMDYIRAGNRLVYGIPAVGGNAHLAFVNLLVQLDLWDGNALQQVVYDGGVQTTLAILNGETDFGIVDEVNAVQAAKDGELRILVMNHPAGSVNFPEVPSTYTVFGTQNTEAFAGMRWIAIPSMDVPDDIVRWITQEIHRATETQAFQDFLISTGDDHLRVYSEEEVTALVRASTEQFEITMRLIGMID
jgi:tripartite-type tricarboxylate transporter receptor subunit TctC